MTAQPLRPQPLPTLYQENFPSDALRARRQRLAEKIGHRSIAVVQGAADAPSAELFRQTNEMYWLTGIESPHAYLLIDGRDGSSQLYLMHRHAELERVYGKFLSAEDEELVSSLTGVEKVAGIESLADVLARAALRDPLPNVLTPFQPGESPATSRDELLYHLARTSSDPWDGRPSRGAHFIGLLRSRFPQLEVANLSPALDALRLIKDDLELELLRYAGWLTAEGVRASMRATVPGAMEYELGAACRYVFHQNGARGGAYRAIVATGTNGWYPHYCRQASPLQSGELVLMDFAPDFAYYTSDIGRMWPVDGTFTPGQRTLFGYIVEYHRALLREVRPGVTADEVLARARAHMQAVAEETDFATPGHRAAAFEVLNSTAHLSHPVGMAVHDIPDYRNQPLQPGMVFSVDPMMRVEDEQQFVRVEDTIAVTPSGYENFTAHAPLDPHEVESYMAGRFSGPSSPMGSLGSSVP